jgi:pullulanase
VAGATPLHEKTDKEGLREVPRVGAFDDDYRNALHGQPEGNTAGWIQNGSRRDELKKAMLVSDWFASPAQQLDYMTCHDNLVLWDKLKLSMPGASDELRKETMKLGYLALFTSQGVPFIHGGEEFARSKGGNGNSYDSPDSVNQVDWSLKRKNYDLFTYTRDLIALRKAHPVFRLRTREEVARRLHFEDTPDEKSLVFTLDGAGVPGERWKHVCVVLNSADAGSADVALPAGQWSVAADERGAALRSVSGKVAVRYKSGLVLFQP